jgi:hypothetical protein
MRCAPPLFPADFDTIFIAGKLPSGTCQPWAEKFDLRHGFASGKV